MYAHCWCCEGRLSSTVGFVKEERANVGVKKNALGLGKIVGYVESSAKTVLATAISEKKYEHT